MEGDGGGIEPRKGKGGGSASCDAATTNQMPGNARTDGRTDGRTDEEGARGVGVREAGLVGG